MKKTDITYDRFRTNTACDMADMLIKTGLTPKDTENLVVKIEEMIMELITNESWGGVIYDTLEQYNRR